MEIQKCFDGLQTRVPCWFMRQAGRYLPEYQQLRQTCPDFVSFCLTPSLVQEATLQPLRRFDLDAAIIFSDILMIPYAMGQKVWFEKGVGPRLEPYKKDLDWQRPLMETLAPVYTSISQVRQALDPQKALIGFAGGPYTLACYMLEGSTSRTFSNLKTWAFQNPLDMETLLESLCHKIAEHLINQIEAGCTMVQIFESWASSVPDAYVERWLIHPLKSIVSKVKKIYPQIPIIGFPKDLGAWIPDYVRQSGIDGVSLSGAERLERLLPQIPEPIVIQGTLDPLLLVAGGEAMEVEILRLLSIFQNRRYIFNLGHGVVPETPPESVARVLEILHQKGKRP